MRALPLLLLVACPGSEDKDGTETATFEVAAATVIDVLYVVDDSVSMSRDHELLADARAELFDGWGAADVHVGFTTTSFDGEPDDATVTWYELDCAADTACLSEVGRTVQVGYDGSDQERGFEVAVAALSSPLAETTNAGFARAGSLRVVVPFSDEEDCSGAVGGDGDTCYDEAALPPVHEWLTALLDLDATARVQVSGIYALEADACESAFPSVRYAEAVERMGGVAGDICERDLAPTIAAIAAAAVAPPDRFRLPGDIEESSAVVTLNGVEVPAGETDGWSWDEDLRFLVLNGTWRPAEGDLVEITYVPA